MRGHYLQHVPFEGLGSIGPWFAAAGCEVTGTRFFETALLPDIDGIDLLVVLGGPMSVNDEAAYPWLVDEKRFIRRCIEADTPVLGICLGAQLIASAMGARVYPNAVKEIGWFPVQGVAAAGDSIFDFPPALQVFHWHGETFDLPVGAILLACSEGCENQAFQLGGSVIGLQFHLEITPQSALDILDNCRAELIPARFVQSEEEILSAGNEQYGSINHVMDSVLSFLRRSDG